MKISVVNGSPKIKENISGLLIKDLISEIKIDKKDITVYHLNKRNVGRGEIEKIGESDVIVFAFPLYVDSFPSLVLEFLMEMEKTLGAKENKACNKSPVVYCILNNGFFEGKQNHVVMRQMKSWCRKTGFTWGQGIGAGSGEMLPAVSKVPIGKGPKKNLGKAIWKLSENIEGMKSGEDIYFSPNYPRFLWMIQAKISWIARARNYGLKRKDLYRKI